MRINVYSQELTNEISIISKEGTDIEGKDATFIGVRIYLHSSEKLHHTPTDDDRSAVTFWLPKSDSRSLGFADTLHKFARLIESVCGY